jgi:hypothetical protein
MKAFCQAPKRPEPREPVVVPEKRQPPEKWDDRRDLPGGGFHHPEPRESPGTHGPDEGP